METTTILKSSILITIFSMFTSMGAMATTYTTLADGNYNDPEIWSTDGGMSLCHCAPSSTTTGDDLVINHNITLIDHLTVNGGSSLLVNLSGTLTGPTFNLVATNNANVLLKGECVFNKLINGKILGTNGATIRLSNIIEFNARIVLYAGVTTIDGGYVYSNVGNFDVKQNAEFYTLSGSKLELFAGNISIEGLVDICSDCCLATKGNWTNEATGIVQGSGSATTSVGNMTNLNSWSTDITWCSNGFDVGMPTPEDCSESNIVCGAVMLPVELSRFEGYNRGSYNELIWETTTEINSDHFLVKKSYDGYNWEVIDQVNAAGNSTSLRHYSSQDYSINLNKSITYYQLEQYDLDGEKRTSFPVSITSQIISHDLIVYPNPATQNTIVHIVGGDTSGELNVVSVNGQVLPQTLVQVQNGEFLISSESLDKGIYFAVYTNEVNGNFIRTRFVVE